MKIVKDTEGYFIVDNRNQKVNLRYKGKVHQKFPTIMHLGLCFWASNEKDNIVTTQFETLVDNISHFKTVKRKILEYLIEENHNETYILTN